jgi:outer membrane immunogenic protein
MLHRAKSIALAVLVGLAAVAPAGANNGSWTGFYVGATLGGRSSDIDWRTTGFFNPAVAPFVAPAGAGFDSTDFRIGGYLGFNWQIAQWLIGIEGDIGFVTDSGRTRADIPGLFPNPSSTDRIHVETEADGSIRARAGVLVSPAVLLFLTGGIAFQQVKASIRCPGDANSWCVANRFESVEKTLTGWTIGGGAEWKLSQRWIARADYRFADFDSFNHAFFASAPIDTVHAKIDTQTHTFNLGIAYRF